MDRKEPEFLTNEAGSTAGGWARWAMIGGLVAAVAGVGAANAMSGDFAGAGGWRDHMGARMMHAHWGGWFMERRIGSVLDEIEATPEQEEKLWQIIDDAHAEIWPMMRGFRDTRDDVAELLGAAAIDREAAERLRAERMAAFDQASRRMTAALLDAAAVLTPEQRTRLVEHFQERGRHRRW